LGQANNAAVFGRLDIAWLRCILVERKVCPRAVIVAEVAAQTTTEVLLVEDDHVVGQLAADGANYALGEGVLLGRAGCGVDLGDAHALHPSAKVDAVCAISIAEEKARRRVIGKGPDDATMGGRREAELTEPLQPGHRTGCCSSWGHHFEANLKKITIRRAPLWNQGLLEGSWVIRINSGEPVDNRLLRPRQTLEEGDKFFRDLLSELYRREPALKPPLATL